MEDVYLSSDNLLGERLLENFFKKRLELVHENKYPIQLSTDPPVRFVMHFIPDKFSDISLDITQLEPPENHLIPLGEAPETILCNYNFDGISFLPSVHEKHSYCQLFRDGRVETVAAIAEGINQPKGNHLPILKLQKSLILSLKNHLTILDKFALPGPFFLFFRLLYVENMRLNPADIATCGYDAKGRNKPLIQNELVFPRYRLEHCVVCVEECLKPFFNILWNAFGFREAPQHSSK